MLKVKVEGGRCSWSNEEVKELLALMKEKKIMQQLDGKTRRNKNVYSSLANELARKGYKKTSDQIKIKFRGLKKEFLQVKRSNNTSGAGRKTIQHFDDLNELLGDRPVAAVMGFDTTTVENVEEDDMKEEMCEEFLDDSFIEVEETISSEKQIPLYNNNTKKKKSGIQMTLLEIAADIKESHQSLIKTIRDENNSFLSEERQLHAEYINNIREIMAEDRKETREMLQEIFNS